MQWRLTIWPAIYRRGKGRPFEEDPVQGCNSRSVVRGRNPSGGSPSKQMGFNPDSGTVRHVREATDSDGWEHRALNNGSKETLLHAAARQD